MLDKNAKIYVAGHRGLVGSAIWKNLEEKGYTNLIGKTHTELDLLDGVAVRRFFDEEQPEYVFLAAAFVSGVLEEFHKGQTHGVNHCTEHVHKDIDGMTDNENQYHNNRACYYIIRTHTYCQAVEYSRQNTSGKSEGKQTNVRQYIAKQTGDHII